MAQLARRCKNSLQKFKVKRPPGARGARFPTGDSQVLERQQQPVADGRFRQQVLRLGRRIATFRADQTHVEELVGAMTGALDQKEAAA